jgi:hypothetical protein
MVLTLYLRLLHQLVEVVAEAEVQELVYLAALVVAVGLMLIQGVLEHHYKDMLVVQVGLIVHLIIPVPVGVVREPLVSHPLQVLLVVVMVETVLHHPLQALLLLVLVVVEVVLKLEPLDLAALVVVVMPTQALEPEEMVQPILEAVVGLDILLGALADQA